MLPSSVRRVVATAPQSPVVSSFASTVPRVAPGAFALSCRRSGGHQRRYSSSSKSTKSDTSAKVISGPNPAEKEEKAVAKAAGGKSKKKAKAQAAPPSLAANLPSVPSTNHISPQTLGLTTFFSQHRPISVTHSVPTSITEELFAQIFIEPSEGRKINSTISTIQNTVSALEKPLSHLNLNSDADDMHHEEQHYDDAGATRVDFRYADGKEASMYVQLNKMSGQFKCFSPPPAPEPQTTEADAAAATPEVDEPAPAPQTRTYKAILTVEETVDANGQYQVTAHSPKLVEEGSQLRFLERMALRQIQWEDARRRKQEQRGENPTMLAISVKRQKKLRMKKKKYKKLMRRTRNERRKLDRV